MKPLCTLNTTTEGVQKDAYFVGRNLRWEERDDILSDISEKICVSGSTMVKDSIISVLRNYTTNWASLYVLSLKKWFEGQSNLHQRGGSAIKRKGGTLANLDG